MKLDLNNNRIPRKYSNTWKLNSTMLKNQGVTKVIRAEFKKFLESTENGKKHSRICGTQQRPCKEESSKL
jgi:hypothetical protein